MGEHRAQIIKGIFLVGVGFALAFGLFLRVADLVRWREQPQAAFYRGIPLLTTFDGYFYARYARDLVEGTYSALDELRAVPQMPPRPSPPPLLALIIAGVVKLTGASVDWISTLLPPFMGILLFFPVYGLGRWWGDRFSGLVAGLIALGSPYYVNRSRLGWLDTDCGNVTFTLAATYFAMRAMAAEKRTEQALYLAGFLVNFLLFLLWWDQAPDVVFCICFGILFSCWLSCGFRALLRQVWLPAAVTALGSIVLVTSLRGFGFWMHLSTHILGYFKYISKAATSEFPNIGVSISEQVHMPFEGIVQIAAANWVVFAAAVLGLILLIKKSPRRAVELVVPVGLGALAILYAKRFAIFLAPLVGLGIGGLTLWLKDQSTRPGLRPLRLGLFWGGCLALPFALWSLLAINLANSLWPVEPPSLIHGMDLARQKTAPQSVIWAWWDHGYPLLYWSRRGAISDGEYHGNELAMINAFPMTTSDYQQAAQWMHFYTARGPSGFHKIYQQFGGVAQGLDVLRKVLAAGRDGAPEILAEAKLEPQEQWFSFFFPDQQEIRPVYLFLDERLMGTSYWWYWLGSWDVTRQEGLRPMYTPFNRVKQNGPLLTGAPAFTVDLEQGLFTSQNTTIPLSRVVSRQGNQWHEVNHRDVGMVFQYDPITEWGVLCSPDIYDSVFNKLFFLGMADVRYFEPVALNTGVFQLWKVHAQPAPPPPEASEDTSPGQ
jgi:hypothetical protein